MKKWLVVMLCGASVAWASELPKVDAVVAEFEAHVSEMRAEFAKTPEAPDDKTWVKTKLRHMTAVDQYARKYSVQEGPARGFSPPEIMALNQQISTRMAAIDAANTADLKKLLLKYPWFGISEFGEEADIDAWLLVQHADSDPAFQRDVIRRLEPLVAKGETKPSNYAYLFDRIAVSYGDASKRRPQRYGTQGQCSGPGAWAPFPVEDPDKLDERRKSMGLMPEAEYQRMFKDLCRESQEETMRKAIEAARPTP